MISRRSLLIGAGLSSFVRPAWSATPGPAFNRDTVVLAMAFDIGTLDPQVSVTPDSARSGWQLFDTLYGFDHEGVVEPRLATSYQISEDGRQYTFTLRPNVVFHNGDPFTAADVVFSIERILKPETKSTRRPYFVNLIDGAEALGDDKVVFRLKQPDGAFINKVAGYLYILPKKYASSLGGPEAFAHAPIGTGPYTLAQRKIGQSLTFERFERFWGDKPTIRTLIFKVVPDPTGRVNALTAGEVDIADDVQPSDLQRLRETPGVAVRTGLTGSPLHVRIYSNVPGEPLANRDVRLALNYAVDKDALIKNVLYGAGAPLTSFISSGYPYGAVKGPAAYPYDPAKAKALLAGAGFPNGFATEIWLPGFYPQGLGEAVVAYWSAVGVEAKIRAIDNIAFNRIDNTHKSGPMDFSQFANAIYDPIHPLSGGAQKGGTWCDYYNPDVERLLSLVGPVADRAQRGELFAKIGQVLTDDGFDVLLSDQYFTVARRETLDWEPQRGGKFYNFRKVAWR